MDRFIQSLDSHAVENVVHGATLVRAAPSLGLPFAYELACCIKQGERFFGLQTGTQEVELVTSGNERHLHIARRELTGIEVNVLTDCTDALVAECDGDRMVSDFTNAEIVQRFVEDRRIPGAVLILDGIQKLIGARSNPKQIIDLCDTLVHSAANKHFPLVIVMDAYADDAETYRRLLPIFDVHVAVWGGSDGGEWRVEQSRIGPTGIGGAFTTRHVYVGEQPNGAWLTANVIDPATCNAQEHYIAAPGARAIAAPVTPIYRAEGALA